MGLFGNKAKPTKAGSYSLQWPAESGLGAGYHEEYLTYSSKRRRTEGVPREDLASMTEAEATIARLGVQDELLLIAGPVDLRDLTEPPDREFSAQAAITSKSTVLWWRGRRGQADQFVVLPHQGLRPKDAGDFVMGYHFIWADGWMGPFSEHGSVAGGHPTGAIGFAVTPHFTKDGHANRRAVSVQATLRGVRGD